MKKSIPFLKINTVIMIVLIAIQASAAIHTINVQNYTFSPSSVPAVNVGDTVRWIWVSGSHTTTSTTIPSGAPVWDHLINSGKTSFDYIPDVTGDYNYKCTPHQSMGMVGSFTVLAPTGVAESRKSPSIKIFTNPFYDHVRFQFNSDYSILRSLRIFDLTGRLCKDFNFEDKPERQIITLDLSDLNAGIYLFDFIDNSNYHNSRRVIKQ